MNAHSEYTPDPAYPMKDLYWCCGLRIGEQHADDCPVRKGGLEMKRSDRKRDEEDPKGPAPARPSQPQPGQPPIKPLDEPSQPPSQTPPPSDPGHVDVPGE